MPHCQCQLPRDRLSGSKPLPAAGQRRAKLTGIAEDRASRGKNHNGPPDDDLKPLISHL